MSTAKEWHLNFRVVARTKRQAKEIATKLSIAAVGVCSEYTITGTRRYKRRTPKGETNG